MLNTIGERKAKLFSSSKHNLPDNTFQFKISEESQQKYSSLLASTKSDIASFHAGETSRTTLICLNDCCLENITEAGGQVVS